MQTLRRHGRALLALLLLSGAGVGAAAASGAFSPGGPTPAQRAAAARARAAAAAAQRLRLAEGHLVDGARSLVDVELPSRSGAAEPALPPALFSAELDPHAVYGFVPYWNLGSLSTADFTDTSVLAYFGLEVGPDGSITRSGNGWDDLAGPGFSSFARRAHAAGDRVLLTASADAPPLISRLLRQPATTGRRLGAQLAALVASKGVDGADLDIEGRSAAERSRFVTFVTAFARTFRALDPGGQVMLDAYPQSAASGTDFIDVAKLAPVVDTIFVMAYDMVDPAAGSANSPLASPRLGLDVSGSLLAYLKVVPASELVLGLPFYGYDFTTAGPAPGSRATSADPVAVTYAAVAAAGHHARWDVGSLTPYTVYKVGGRWHQTWYDDPLSIALKTAAAEELRLGGTGAWALGQEGASSAMLRSLDGWSGPEKLPIAPLRLPSASPPG